MNHLYQMKENTDITFKQVLLMLLIVFVCENIKMAVIF